MNQFGSHWTEELNIDRLKSCQLGLQYWSYKSLLTNFSANLSLSSSVFISLYCELHQRSSIFISVFAAGGNICSGKLIHQTQQTVKKSFGKRSIKREIIHSSFTLQWYKYLTSFFPNVQYPCSLSFFTMLFNTNILFLFSVNVKSIPCPLWQQSEIRNLCKSDKNQWILSPSE